jgi:hypothetical protein
MVFFSADKNKSTATLWYVNNIGCAFGCSPRNVQYVAILGCSIRFHETDPGHRVFSDVIWWSFEVAEVGLMNMVVMPNAKTRTKDAGNRYTVAVRSRTLVLGYKPVMHVKS